MFVYSDAQWSGILQALPSNLPSVFRRWREAGDETDAQSVEDALRRQLERLANLYLRGSADGDRPYKPGTARQWSSVEKAARELANVLRDVPCLESPEFLRQVLPNAKGLVAEVFAFGDLRDKITAIGAAAELLANRIPQQPGPPVLRKPARDLFLISIIGLWERLGGKLRISNHPKSPESTGATGTGPLIRFVTAVADPVLVDGPASGDMVAGLVKKMKKDRSSGWPPAYGQALTELPPEIP